jgi:magnesium chelatase accessory protein
MLGTPAQIDRLLTQTGAQIGAEGRDQYLTLARRPAHIGATLDMMAAWDLRPLLARLSHITVPVLLLTGARDGAVPPRVSTQAARALPHATAQIIQGYGHLLPEEAARVIAPIIINFLARSLAETA